MRKNLKTLLVASTLAAGLAAAPAIYAHDSDGANGSMMGRGMMGHGGMMGMMGQGGMMGPGGMMENCSQMMQAMMGMDTSLRDRTSSGATDSPHPRTTHGHRHPTADQTSKVPARGMVDNCASPSEEPIIAF
jgi:hypothetical protein